jgi:protein-glutamine gamma-glutamyltransferase
MNVERSVRIESAMLACFGTLMLAFGEESAGLAAAAIIVGVIAYVACDVFNFALTGFWSNIATLGVLLLAALQARSMAPEERILAMADLMAYLQFVLLFRPKTPRNLWLIALVSFLQVAVASALNTGLGFAVSLLVYLFTGVLFLGQFFLYRERARFNEAAAEAGRRIAAGRGGFVGGAQDEPEGRRPSREFSRRMTGMVVGTIVLAAFFFVAVPRLGQSTWVANQIGGARTVGFSQEINLARAGQIVEDPDIVMRAHFKDRDTGAAFNPVGELYLRGMAVTKYEDGKWTQPFGNQYGNQYPSQNTPSPPPLVTNILSDERGLVEQHVAIEPLSRGMLFSCYPAFGTNESEEVIYHPQRMQLNRPERFRAQRYTYTLVTAAFRRDDDLAGGTPGKQQAEIIPVVAENGVPGRVSQAGECTPSIDLHQPFYARNIPGGPLRETTPDEAPLVGRLVRLREVAREVVKDIPAADVYSRARALEAYLRDHGGFTYSLSGEQRPKDVDPLEDFVGSRRNGHCEFFAGALAMMLRSVGIPARVVLGYRGGEWNAVGNFYQFRQLHAHSWVEAYLKPNEVPPASVASPELRKFAVKYGAWLQLDGTTSNTSTDLATTDSTWYQLRQTVDYLQFLWNNYVLGMDALRQRDEVYKPLAESVASMVNRETDRETWKARITSLYEAVIPESIRNSGGRSFGLAAVLAALSMLLAAWFVRRLRRRARSAAEGANRGRRVNTSGPAVDFYVRLETVLARRHLTRPADQTQREFIQAACGELAELPETRAVAALPRKIVEAFYRVRFGKRALESGQQSEIEQALAKLDAVLGAPKK